MLKQLSRATQAAERVLDLMRQIADQLAIGLLLLDQALFAGGGEMVINRLQFKQQAHAVRHLGA